MEYSATELKGAGTLNKSILEAGSDYTFFLYRPPNQTGHSSDLSGSGYFTFETSRDANGFYGSTVRSYVAGAVLNPSVASNNTASFGVKTLVSSSYVFSYDLYATTSSNAATPFEQFTATSSFQFTPAITVPLSSVFFRATGDYEMEVSPETQDCGGVQTFQGGQNYPTQLQSILGSSTGTNVTISVRTGGQIPDRWIATLGGTQVLDTGYICPSNNAGFGQPGRNGVNGFTTALQGRLIPEGPITFNGIAYPNYPVGGAGGLGGSTTTGVSPNIIEPDGYPRVVTFTPIGPFPIQDNTTFTFPKNTVASVLNVSVYGPQTGTSWTNNVACPV